LRYPFAYKNPTGIVILITRIKKADILSITSRRESFIKGKSIVISIVSLFNKTGRLHKQVIIIPAPRMNRDKKYLREFLTKKTRKETSVNKIKTPAIFIRF
jgi:hypothetical protein